MKQIYKASLGFLSVTILFVFTFQNCAKVQFSPKDNPELNELSKKDLVDAVDPVKYESPITPAGPVHGDIVGTLKPFAVEAQKIVPKTKMVIVVDNSGSMKNSQEHLAKGVESMLTSLESQIQDGINPDVEFYIVTTSIPQNNPQPLSLTTKYLGNSKYQYISTFYGKNLYYNLTNQAIQNYKTVDSISVESMRENNARLTQFNLHYPNSTLNISKTDLSNLADKGEFLPFAYDGNCVTCEPTKTTYDKFKSYIGFNSATDSDLIYYNFYNDWSKPKYIYSSSGTPLSYNAKFEFNTNFPIYNASQTIISSVPFKKLTLSPDVYLTSAKSADRVFNPEKFSIFKKDLASTIKSVSTKGSNKEMGLCALHRSLTMSGENQIFQQGDRAAFLIISDEQDAMTDWNECPQKSEISKEKPLTFDLVSTCSGGSSCIFPSKESDYSASFNWQIDSTNPAEYNTQKTPHVHYNFSRTYNQAGNNQPNYKYFRYLNIKYVTGYTSFINSEGRATALNDGKDGRPLDYSYRTLTMAFNSLTQYQSSPYLVHDLFTEQQAADLPRAKDDWGGVFGIACRQQDTQAVINGLLAEVPAFKSIYNSTATTDQAQLISSCYFNDRFSQTIVTDSGSTYSDLPTVSNAQCQIINQEYKAGIKCSEAERLDLETKSCAAYNKYYTVSSTCSVSNCYHSCSPAEKRLIPQNKTVLFKTSDKDFAVNFHAGYNLSFQAGSYVFDIFGLGGISTAFKTYNTYEEFLIDQKIPANATAANGGSLVINKTPEPTAGSKTFAQITTDYSEVVKLTDVATQAKSEGISLTPVVMDSKTMTSKDYVAKMKEQMITSFHMRAKKMFNNNYFVSSIVIPNDGTYASGMCPGTPLTEEQSPGTAYLQLLDDAYFTNNIEINGQVTSQVDQNRKAFADICKGDFTPALSPLKDFITNVAKDTYEITIPSGREIHSIVVKHSDANAEPQTILSQQDWNYDGKQISIDINKIQIGDSITVNLTLPQAVEVRAPANSN